MLTRRLFAGCALCAAGGVLLAETGTPARAAGLTRTVLNRTEYPGEKMVTLQMLVEIEPDFLVPRHTHPGVENSTLLEGGGVLGVRGQPDRTVAAGDSFQIPYGTPHLLRNGPARTRLVGVYVVEKDKPLATPAPE
jgi:quercetin dioxygenase-like cupin family protein